jgi:hypothetical protein
MQRLVCVSNVYFNSATTLATFTILPYTMPPVTPYITGDLNRYRRLRH